jgi:hypothetical protein
MMHDPARASFWTAIAALVGIGQLLILALTAIFVWCYLLETKRLRVASQELVEASFRPAIVVSEKIPGELNLANIGNGPALRIGGCSRTEAAHLPFTCLNRQLVRFLTLKLMGRVNCLSSRVRSWPRRCIVFTAASGAGATFH